MPQRLFAVTHLPAHGRRHTLTCGELDARDRLRQQPPVTAFGLIASNSVPIQTHKLTLFSVPK